MAQRLADEAFCLLGKVTDLTVTYDAPDDEPLNTQKVVLEEAHILLFERVVRLPHIMLMDADGYIDGSTDGAITFGEATGHFMRSLEKHDCEEVDGLARRIRGGALAWELG